MNITFLQKDVRFVKKKYRLPAHGILEDFLDIDLELLRLRPEITAAYGEQGTLLLLSYAFCIKNM